MEISQMKTTEGDHSRGAENTNNQGMISVNVACGESYLEKLTDFA
jgi:hypothetical protein